MDAPSKVLRRSAAALAAMAGLLVGAVGSPAGAVTANQSFVLAAYTDFVGYEPELADIDPITDAFDAGTMTRANLLTIILDDPGFEDAYTYKVFELYIDRLPTSTEMTAARTATTAGDFLEPELLALATADYSSGAAATNSGFVTSLYEDLLGRTPDAGGLSYWTARLDSGTSRKSVARSIVRISESARRRVVGASATSCAVTELSQALDLLAGSYCIVLDRPADSGGADYWTTYLSTSGGQLPYLWRQLAASPEYLTNALARFP